MRTIKLLIPALLLVCSSAFAQTEATELNKDFRSRFAVGADWKIVKGVHLSAEYEARFADNMSRFSSNFINVGVSYSPVKYLDINAGYCFIASKNKAKEFHPRHRIFASVTGSYKFGAWKLSLREMLQLTHKSYDFNRFQQTPNSLQLRSRLKLAYKGFIHLEPYTFVELRNCFNAPTFSADYSEVTGKYSNYEFKGYSDAYIEQVRGALGLQWKITKNHGLDFRVMVDWGQKKKIDTNAEGTKLKDYYWKNSLTTLVGVGYKFSF